MGGGLFSGQDVRSIGQVSGSAGSLIQTLRVDFGKAELRSNCIDQLRIVFRVEMRNCFFDLFLR